jgi:hypothetical protein
MSDIGAPKRIIRVEPEPVKVPQPVKTPVPVKVPERVGVS